MFLLVFRSTFSDHVWANRLGPKLQDLLIAIRDGLSEKDLLGISTPCDEYRYWLEMSQKGQTENVRKRAALFAEQFQSINRDFESLRYHTLIVLFV